jgi:hypothetical protein
VPQLSEAAQIADWHRISNTQPLRYLTSTVWSSTQISITAASPSGDLSDVQVQFSAGRPISPPDISNAPLEHHPLTIRNLALLDAE